MRKTCQTCDSILVHGASGSYCPVCALRASDDDLPLTELETQGAGPGVPREFGDYELLAEIGHGGMGLVYRARQRSLNRVVALKVLLAGRFAGRAARERFRREAESSAGLQHPNIVAVHDVGEAEGHPYLTMDFIEGKDLAELCDGRPLPVHETAPILCDVARAVQVAHDTGVLHRDLKPSNILMGSDRRPRVTDFGLALRTDEEPGLTMTGQMLGSPNYTSPEQAAGRHSEIGVRSDVYGLGALLYHLLTGRAPFNAATPAETLVLVLETDPPSPRVLNPAVPRELEIICLKCLEKTPARRYATAAEVADDIECYLDHRPIRARPPNVLYRLRKFARRYRTGVVASGAVLAVLIAGLVVALVAERKAERQRSAAEEARRTAETARLQAESLLDFLLRDLHPDLARYGRVADMRKIAEDAVSYFEKLPAELRNNATDRAHASALEAVSDICGMPTSSEVVPVPIDMEVGARAARQALELRRELADRDPNDPAARAAFLDATWRASDYNSLRTTAEWDELQQWMIKEYRELERRFPNHDSVFLGLARALSRRASYASGIVNKPREGLAAGLEGRRRFEQILATGPLDDRIRADYARSLVGLAVAYAQCGESKAAEAVWEEAVEFADRCHEDDPGNVLLLSIAAMTRMEHAWFLWQRSKRKARDVGLIARARLLRLTEMDPENIRWKIAYTECLTLEGWYFVRDGRLDLAREAFLQREAVHEKLPDSARNRNNLIGSRIALAKVAAALGEASAAHQHLREAEVWHSTYQDAFPEPPRVRRLRDIMWMSYQSEVFLALEDWPALLKEARNQISIVEAALQDEPDDPDLRMSHSWALNHLGVALLRHGNLTEAVRLFRQVLEQVEFAPEDDVDLATGVRSPFSAASDRLGEALTDAGDREAARSHLETVLELRQANLEREPDLWISKTSFARTAWLLARALDPKTPEEAERRRALVNRAQDILSGPEAEMRMTPSTRDLKTKIEALRLMLDSHEVSEER